MELEVTFTPPAPGQYQAQLYLTSNNAAGDSLLVTLVGVGVNPPVITVDPDSIYAVAEAGEVVYDTLLITNNGECRLDYSISSTFWFKPKPEPNNLAAKLAAHEEVPAKGEPDYRRGTVVQSGGGTDGGFGYSWEDNQDGGGPDYDWTDIRSSGTDVTADVNGSFFADGSVQVPIGFTFTFYNQPVDSIYISANGFLHLTELGSTFSNRRIPVADAVNNIIAGFWDDLEPGAISGTVHYLNEGDRFIAQYTNVGAFGSSREGTITYQIILYADGRIKFQYQDVNSANFLNSSTVGIENEDGTEGIEIAFNSAYLTDGLAIEFNGPVSGSVAPGETERVPVALDARGLNAGIYQDSVLIRSNDPATPVVGIPVTLEVIGFPEIAANPDSLNFGTVYVSPDSSFAQAQTVVISNTGRAPLTIDSVYTTSPAFTFEANGDYSNLAPNDSVQFTVTFDPDSVGNYTAELVFVSNDLTDSLFSVALSGEGVAPPVFSATTDGGIIRAVLKSTEVAQDEILITNTGGSLLTYQARVFYQQPVDTTVAQGFQLAAGGRMLSQSTSPMGRAGTSPVNGYRLTNNGDVVFIDSIFYDNADGVADDFVGIPSPDLSFATAAKFVAPAEGFNLTHVRNLFRLESSTEAITISIWRGGSTPGEATLLTSQPYTGGTSEGSFELIKLNELQNFAAGETFWISAFYPKSITFGQGVDLDVAGVEGIYYYSGDEGASWSSYDSAIPGAAAKIRALQAQPESQWISLNPSEGEVEPGESETINVTLDAGELEEGGRYTANIVLSSNDPFNPTESIPVEIYVNKLPKFVVAPADTVQVSEGGEITLKFSAVDEDGRILVYTLEERYKNARFKVQRDTATITFKPNYEQSGFYTFTVKALDNQREQSTQVVVVEVLNVNRGPQIVRQINRQNLRVGQTKALDLSRFIRDADNDELTYEVIPGDSTIVAVDMLDNVLFIEGVGKGRTFVSIIASDPEGLRAATSFEVRVQPAKKNANSAPVVVAPIVQVNAGQNAEQLVYDLSGVFQDPDGDALQFSLIAEEGVPASVEGSKLYVARNLATSGGDFLIVADDGRGGITQLSYTEALSSNLGNEEAASLKLHPNPAILESFIDYRLEAKNRVQVDVIAADGRVVFTQKLEKEAGSHRLRLNTSSYKVGLYIIRLRLGDSVHSQRLVIKK